MAIKLTDRLAVIFKRAPKKALKDIAGGMDLALNQTVLDLGELDLQYRIATASEEWLDEWGSWFNVYREIGEQDNEYRGRILSTVSTPKNTIPAIKQAVATYLSSYYGVKIDPSQVDIYEPYTNIIKYSMIHSAYSSDDKYPDEFLYRSNVIVIVIPYGATQGLKQLLETIKPAGLKVLFDVQLVPEVPEGTHPGPVDFIGMKIIEEKTDISQYNTLIGIDGFFHPHMEGMMKYSGVKNLDPGYFVELHRTLQMLSPVSLQSYYENILQMITGPEAILPVPVTEIGHYLEALGSDGYADSMVPIYDNEISYAPPKVIMYGAEPSDMVEIEAPRYALLVGVDHIPTSRDIELSLGIALAGDVTATYEGNILYFLNYNDDSFNIKLGSGAKLVDIGDVPLNQPSWVTGPVQIEILPTP